MTVTRLIEQLRQLVLEYPDMADWRVIVITPVHMDLMAPESSEAITHG